MTAPDAVPSVTVTELSALLSNGAALIDVREPDEHAEVRVPGVPLIPLGSLMERVAEVPSDRVYVICRSGARSGRAVAWLRTQGFDAVNVAGGTLGWVEAGLPTESGA